MIEARGWGSEPTSLDPTKTCEFHPPCPTNVRVVLNAAVRERVGAKFVGFLDQPWAGIPDQQPGPPTRRLDHFCTLRASLMSTTRIDPLLYRPLALLQAQLVDQLVQNRPVEQKTLCQVPVNRAIHAVVRHAALRLIVCPHSS